MDTNHQKKIPTDQEKPFPDRKWYAAVLLTLTFLVALFYFFTKYFK